MPRPKRGRRSTRQKRRSGGMAELLWMIRILWWVALPAPPALPATAPPQAWASLKSIDYAAEIVGPHESWGTFHSEVEYLWRHARDLRGAPRICDAYRLPPGEPYECVASSQLTSLEAWCEQAEWRQEMYAAQTGRIRTLCTFWELVREAKAEGS